MSKQLSRPETTFIKRMERTRTLDMGVAIGALMVLGFVFGAVATVHGAYTAVNGDVLRGIVSAVLGGIGLWAAIYGSTNFRDQ